MGQLDELHQFMTRIDERTLSLQRELGELKEMIVSQDEFSPVKRVVYGLVGLILTTCMGALLALIIKNGN